MVKSRALPFLSAIFVASMLFITPLRAEEVIDGPITTRDTVIEKAGVGYGVTFGNLIYPGFKAATMILAAPQAALAWVLSLGDTKQAKTVWESHMEGPYYISPETARKAMAVDEESKPYEREYTE